MAMVSVLLAPGNEAATTVTINMPPSLAPCRAYVPLTATLTAVPADEPGGVHVNVGAVAE